MSLFTLMSDKLSADCAVVGLPTQDALTGRAKILQHQIGRGEFISLPQITESCLEVLDELRRGQDSATSGAVRTVSSVCIRRRLLFLIDGLIERHAHACRSLEDMKKLSERNRQQPCNHEHLMCQ